MRPLRQGTEQWSDEGEIDQQAKRWAGFLGESPVCQEQEYRRENQQVVDEEMRVDEDR